MGLFHSGRRTHNDVVMVRYKKSPHLFIDDFWLCLDESELRREEMDEIQRQLKSGGQANTTDSGREHEFEQEDLPSEIKSTKRGLFRKVAIKKH